MEEDLEKKTSSPGPWNPNFHELCEIKKLIRRQDGGHYACMFYPQDDGITVEMESYHHDLDGPGPCYSVGRLVKEKGKWWYKGKDLGIMKAMKEYYQDDEIMGAVYRGLIEILSAK